MDQQVGAAVSNLDHESSHSAVSWGAVIAGGSVSVAISFVLVTLGAGLGLAAISPFANAGASATGFGISTAIGLIVVQWLASASGGFITGRLRTKWVGVHTHEVFFRDTAHGLLTWTLATLVTIMLVVSAASSVIGGGARATAAIGGSLDQAASPAISQAMTGTRAYDVDRLFRSDRPDPTANAQNANAQATRILAEGLVNGDVPAADRSYLAQIITLRTGISQADAEQRVDSVIAREKAVEVKARQAADTARKAASELAIFTALSMLIGAFIACVAAAYGGNVRDEF
jgi:hypothetical protein